MTQYTTGIVAEGTCTWTVAAYDAVGHAGAYTGAWSFVVDTTAPDPAALVSSVHGAHTSDRTPALVWQASPSPDVAGYLLDFDGTVVDVGDATQHTTSLLAYRSFDWTVAAYDAVGNTSAYAGTWSFTTGPHRLYLPLLVKGYPSTPSPLRIDIGP